jgi:hypothetical protein
MKTSHSLAIGAAVLSLVLGWVVWQRSVSNTEHSASASVAAKTAKTTADHSKETGPPLAARLLKGELPKLTAAQLNAFVEKNHHSAASLLAAWSLGGDKAWLEEAVSRYPDNPQVAFAKLASLSQDENSDERKEWIGRLQKDAPQNAIGWCYAALDAFKDGRTTDAMDALMDASLRSSLNCYRDMTAQACTEAYRDAGYDSLEAEALGRFNTPIPEVSMFMTLAKELTQANSGDSEALASLLPLADMVREENGSPALIQQLVSVAMEKMALKQMNALDEVPGSDVLVADRLSELDSETALVRDTSQQAAPLLTTMTDSEFKQYLRRSQVQGELKAMQWLIARKQAH